MLISEMIEWVEDEVPHVPPPTAQRALKKVLRDFFSFTYTWREENLSITGDGDCTEAEVVIPKNTTIARLEQVYVGDVLANLSSPAPTGPTRYTDTTAPASGVYNVYQRTSSGITFIPALPAQSTVRVTAALTPTLRINLLPDTLFEQFEDAIIEGALARLKSQRGASWFSSGEAQIHEARYLDLRERARLKGRHDQSRKKTVCGYGGI